MQFLKTATPYILAAVILITICLFVFRSQLEGKKISTPDEVSYIGASAESRKSENQTRPYSFWTNSLFSGMPTYQIDKLPLNWTPFDFIKKGLGMFMDPMLSLFIAMTLLCFVSFILMGIHPWIAALGAFAFTFTSGHFVLAATGHYTKLDALVYLPLILAGFYLIFNQKKLLGFILFTIGLIYNIQANHIQMTYYIFFAIGIYGLIELIDCIKNKSYTDFLHSTGLIVVGLIFAILGNIAHLKTMKDYANETVRGKTILVQSNNVKNSEKAKDGLDWNFATEFSDGYLDLVSMIIPGYVGGSGREKISTTSALAVDFQKNSKKVSDPFFAPLYWGSLPLSSGPNYIGIISFILFCIGLVYIKGNFKYWALASFIFMVLQSLGHHFFLNQFLFDYLPYYNKFRSPDSILLVATVIVPWFGFYTLYKILDVKWKEYEIKALLKKSAFPVIGFMLLMLIVGPFIFDFSNSGDKNFWPNQSALVDTRVAFMVKDSLRSIVLALALITILYYTLINKLSRNYFYGLLTLLLVYDLIPIANRCLPQQDYKINNEISENLSKSSGDIDILRDRDLHYRVMDKANNTFNDSYASLYHKSIGGYHPAKLRRYQDLIDGYLSKGHQSTIDMLNAKYIINPDGKIITNATADGNAWFVDTVWMAHSANEEYDDLKKIDPKHQAVLLENEFPNYLDKASYKPDGNITLIEYHSDQLIYKYNTATPQLAVFSEIWYGPDKGWKATIDGQPVPHVRVNYVLRSLKLPAGTHTIEFKFYPDKVWSLIKINQMIMWVLFLVLFSGITYLIKNKYFNPKTIS